MGANSTTPVTRSMMLSGGGGGGGGRERVRKGKGGREGGKEEKKEEEREKKKKEKVTKSLRDRKVANILNVHVLRTTTSPLESSQVGLKQLE